MSTINILVLFLISVLASFFTNAIFRSVAKRYKILIDLPDKNRKFHKRPTPLTGGISILTGSIMAIFFAVNLNVIDLEYTAFNISILICSFLIVAVFLFDDGYGISPRLRLITQITTCGLLIILSKIYLLDMGNLLFYGNINLGEFGPAITIFCAVGIMNAFNMVDGINGLCSGLSAMVFVFLGIFYNGFIGTQLIFALGAIFGFLIFNLGIIGKKRWIFLGDSGSNLLGFLVAFALIAGSQDPSFGLKPVTALWLVAIPLLDCLGLIIKRLNRGVGPFDADRDHLHHRFMDAGYSAKKTLLIMISIASVVSLFGVIIEKFVPEYISLILFGVFAGLFYYLSHLLKEGAFGVKVDKNVSIS